MFWGFLYSFIVLLIAVLVVLLFVAFFVLAERKILSAAQIRKGPNKTGIGGVLQSFADLLKMILKVPVLGFVCRSWVSWLGLGLVVLVCLGLCWVFLFSMFGFSSGNLLLWWLLITSLTAYGLLSIGWGSYNKYGIISSIRSAFGSVSFEAVFMCVALIAALRVGSYSLGGNFEWVWMTILVVPICYGLWLVGILCEANRTPFDFAEAESELVSGLNVEYGSVPFACIFVCEYLVMTVFSWFTAIVFFGGLLVGVMGLLHVVFYIWARGTLPRVRYDFFVNLMWKVGLMILLLSLFIYLQHHGLESLLRVVDNVNLPFVL